MGGTSNEVGEFAERLVTKYYNAEQLTASNKSADLKTKDNKFIQVKSRKIEYLTTTSLNVIRSWDFDILVVVLFSKEGNILRAIEIGSEDAKSLSKWNGHQNGYILTTSKEVLNHYKSKNMTINLQNIIDGDNNYELDEILEKKKFKEINDHKMDKSKNNHYKLVTTDDEASEIKRVKNRIFRWFKNKDQINSKILYAYIKLYEKNNVVQYDDLKNEVNISINISTFGTNFEQMKTIAPHNHGKIFEQKDNKVILWDKIEKIIWDYYNHFIKQGYGTQRGCRISITV
jgi:hypothetical protein